MIQDKKSGWKLTRIKCDDPGGDTKVDLKNRKATIKIRDGERVRCVFTNEKK